MSTLIKFKKLLLDILFPSVCVNCKKDFSDEKQNNLLCQDCLKKIAINTTLFCGQCQARLPENKKICHKNFPYLLGAATNFNDPIRNLIHQFKYRHWKRAELPIADIIKIYLGNLKLTSRQIKNWTVLPVPLHKNRERNRGFNQAELIGKIIAANLKLPIRGDLLLRIKETKNQAELKDWQQRKNNVKDAFQVTDPKTIQGKNILLVDDVYTSGATINEAIRLLKESGARKIIAMVVAKAR
ncbi:MAG: ComF family protein [Candidatus Harrisonbacteria bacterium]|nr:ComF family protein [Candidatus Harrisonbacteria bacterium]